MTVDDALVLLGSGANSLTVNTSNIIDATVIGGVDVDTIEVNATTIADLFGTFLFGDDTVDVDTVTILDRVYLNGGFGANVLTQNALTLPVANVNILNFN